LPLFSPEFQHEGQFFDGGIALMALFSCFRLWRQTDLAHAVLALATTVILVALFWKLGPVLKPLGNLNLVIFD
jgi:NADH:ubiquinone oxidoreductase subunit 6 (subunit J)